MKNLEVKVEAYSEPIQKSMMKLLRVKIVRLFSQKASS